MEKGISNVAPQDNYGSTRELSGEHGMNEAVLKSSPPSGKQETNLLNGWRSATRIPRLNNTGTWSQERTAQLCQLWSEGLSAAQIAKRLGGGISRCAVIGRARRLGLPGRPNNQPRPRPNGYTRKQCRRRKAKVFGAAAPARAEFLVTPSGMPAPLNINFANLKLNQCRYPNGEGSDMKFCGHPQRHGSSYCQSHHSVCWVRR